MSEVKKISLKDFPKVIKKHIHKIQADSAQTMYNEVLEGLNRLVEESPVDTGEYASSWDILINENKAKISLGNYAPHSLEIEYGSPPKEIPISPLLGWAKRVLQDSSQPPNYSPQVWKLAVGTQKKIAKEGRQPLHLLKHEIEEIKKEIKKNVGKRGGD